MSLSKFLAPTFFLSLSLSSRSSPPFSASATGTQGDSTQLHSHSQQLHQQQQQQGPGQLRPASAAVRHTEFLRKNTGASASGKHAEALKIAKAETKPATPAKKEPASLLSRDKEKEKSPPSQPQPAGAHEAAPGFAPPESASSPLPLRSAIPVRRAQIRLDATILSRHDTRHHHSSRGPQSPPSPVSLASTYVLSSP